MRQAKKEELLLRSRSFLFVFMLILVCAPSQTRGQAWKDLLAPDRAVDWSSAGAGAIPARNTICQTLGVAGQAASYPQSVTAAQLVSALQSCPSGEALYLNPGTYTMTTSLFGPGNGGTTPSNVTLRGAGADQTILKFTAFTNNCLGIGPAGICIYNGDPNALQYATNVLTWTAGYAPGTTTITLGSAVHGSLANLHVGSLLQLNQLDDSNTDNGSWWQCGTFPYCTWGGTSNAWPGRSLTQTVTVTGISGSNVTISPGIYGPKWSASYSPYAMFSSSLPVSNFGLENLQVNTQSLGDEQAMVNMVWASHCWLKGVALINNDAPGNATATRKHVEVAASSHITIRDSYLYGGSPSSESYGIDFMFGTSDSLAENNIAHHMASAYMLETGTGDVFGYNYDADNYYTGAGGAPNWQQCDAYHHDAGDFDDLWEGHQGICAYEDDGHGTAFGLTYFRDYFNGHDPATTCPPTSPNCGTGQKLQNTCALCDQAFNRYTNMVASVLGSSDYDTVYQNQGVPGSPNSCPAYSWTVIYSLNFGNGNQIPFSPTCTQTSYTIDNDPVVSATLMRWGNYDTVNGSVQTNPSETAANAPGYPGLASPSTSWSSYPSFYLSGKPSWWVFPNGNASTPWPAAGPDVTGGNVANVGGHVYLNPAANCFLNVLGGKTDGSSGPLNFDASACYPASASSPTPPAPLNLTGTLVQ